MGAERPPSTAQVALLMTRPQAASQRFVAELPEALLAGLRVIHAPLLQISPLEVKIEYAGFAGVIFTSANGVAAAGKPVAGLPVYCVGQRTANSAKKAGWQAQVCGGAAAELVAGLRDLRPPVPLLHLHGRHTRGEVATRLTELGLPCSSQVIYEQQLLPLSLEIKQEISAQSDVMVPLFSPRTARHFASLGLDQVNLSLIALSDAVAAELKDLNCKDLRVSKTPDAIGMAAMVRDAAVRLTHLEGDNPAQ
ncbi:uroporphyrinogen-III synthase [Pseudophaeobacter sp.]|uniref:uroporphyrinogen-III synthase n=1 Tax=Pseudophaeobacter sp. TaxID=1971739 RepID=UPI00405A422B